MLQEGACIEGCYLSFGTEGDGELGPASSAIVNEIPMSQSANNTQTKGTSAGGEVIAAGRTMSQQNHTEAFVPNIQEYSHICRLLDNG